MQYGALPLRRLLEAYKSIVVDTSYQPSVNPSLSDYEARILSNGGSALTSSQRTAFNSFLDGLDAAGLRSKISEVYVFHSSIATSRTKLLYVSNPTLSVASASTNFGDPDVTKRGLQNVDANNSKYIRCNFAPLNVNSSSNFHLLVTGGNMLGSTGGDKYFAGLWDGSSNVLGIYVPGATSNVVGLCGNTGVTTAFGSHRRGNSRYCLNSRANTELKTFVDGTLQNNNTTARSFSSSLDLHLYGLNENNAAISTFTTSPRLQFVSVGVGLTDAEVATYDGLISTLLNAIGWHNDTIAYLDQALLNQGQTFSNPATGVSLHSTATLDAIDNNLTRPLQSLKSKLSGLYPIAGTGLNAARAQLFGLASLTLINFVEGDYTQGGSTGGLKGDGTTKHADTGILANSLSFSNSSFGVYASEIEVATAGKALGAAWDNTVSPVRAFGVTTALNPVRALGYSGEGGIYVEGYPTSSGFVAVSSTSNTDLRLIQNSSVLSSTSVGGTTRSTALPARNIFLFARNLNGSADSRSSLRMRSALIGQGFTTAELQAIYTALHNYNTAMGRAA